MPAYNEAENIETTIQQWYKVADRIKEDGTNCKLVIANDGSKDNTYVIMQSLQKKYPDLIPLNKSNSGHGATLLYLYRYALDNNADYVFQTDSDGQTNPDELWQMWNCKEEYDIQIGNRYSRQDGISRMLVSFVLKMVVLLIFHEWVKDANTPFRLINGKKLSELMEVIPDGFFLSNVAISAIAQKWNYKVGWHDISFRPRQGGVNSINMKRIVKIGWKAMGDFKQITNHLKKK